MKDPELKIRELLPMDWTEEQRKKLLDWLNMPVPCERETKSSSRPEFKPTPMRVAEPSDPIFSKPTLLTFASNATTSTQSSENDSTNEPEKPAKDEGDER
jgi:hypothetical protein